MEKQQYIIITSATLQELIDEVNKFANKGYKLFKFEQSTNDNNQTNLAVMELYAHYKWLKESTK